MPGDMPAGLQIDRESARSMISAITYVPPLDHTAFAYTAQQERKTRKAAAAAAAAKKVRMQDSDAVSVSSFSSTVGLLKGKLSRRDKSIQQPQSTAKTLRSQVNIAI